LSKLHSADDDAVAWLTSYSSTTSTNRKTDGRTPEKMKPFGHC